MEAGTTSGDGSPGWWRQAFDELDCGIVVVQGERVEYANHDARSRLGQTDGPVRLCGDAANERLCAPAPADDRCLGNALRGAQATGQRQMVDLGRGAARLSLAVSPLAHGALVVLGKRAVCAPLAARWFCRWHALTPAESSVFSDLLAGHVPRAIAGRHGVALSTVRTQIAAIKHKTDVRDIRHLLLAAASLPPVASRALMRAA